MNAFRLLEICRERNLKIATAESCTGGMVAALLTDIPGSSDVFERGYVTYSNKAKRDMLGVSSETLARFGAVSKEVAREMAEGALQRSGANLAVSITGVAGPGRSESKPEGRVCLRSCCDRPVDPTGNKRLRCNWPEGSSGKVAETSRPHVDQGCVDLLMADCANDNLPLTCGIWRLGVRSSSKWMEAESNQPKTTAKAGLL